MVFRRCPQCGSTSDDLYGFCIKCGYEFGEIPKSETVCPLCGFDNPDEADFCVKCGTPLLFKNQLKDNSYLNPIVIKRTSSGQEPIKQEGRFTKILILLGYVFSILGGLIGLIIAIYLITRKDPSIKRHGYIQLAIFGFYIALIAVLLATGNIPPEVFAEYKQLIAGNLTSI